MLNIGFRFPAVGASDYPYCRALGDSRIYVQSSMQPGPLEWIRGAAQGRSFFTTGPMLLPEVKAQLPGACVRRESAGLHWLRAAFGRVAM